MKFTKKTIQTNEHTNIDLQQGHEIQTCIENSSDYDGKFLK
jgi:hypothetical protein